MKMLKVESMQDGHTVGVNVDYISAVYPSDDGRTIILLTRNANIDIIKLYTPELTNDVIAKLANI